MTPIIEAVARAHWNAQCVPQRIARVLGTETERRYGYKSTPVLWSDEDMLEEDREVWRGKTKAALLAAADAFSDPAHTPPTHVFEHSVIAAALRKAAE